MTSNAAEIEQAYPGHVLTITRQLKASPERVLQPFTDPTLLAIDTAMDGVKHCLEVVDGQIGESTWLAGEQIFIADLFLCPIFTYVGMMPEGPALFGACENIPRTGALIRERASFSETLPPMPGSEAA